MSRVLSVYLPMWSIDRMRRRRRRDERSAGAARDAGAEHARGTARRGGSVSSSAPPQPRAATPPTALSDAPAIVLVRTVASRELVARRCERAIAAGVREEMTLAHARALLPPGELIVHPYEPRRDEEALRALAHWAVQFAPLVAPDPPDGLLMDISGCARLYRGEAKLLNTVANRLEWLGFRTRAAIASTFGAAWALARFGSRERAIIPDGEEREALAPLPIDGLRLEDGIADDLAEVGVETIGQLLELPRLELAARFPAALLLRLDQALGEAMETIDPVRPVEPPRVERLFDGPVKQVEGIVRTVHDLVEDLAARLAQMENGARRLVVTFERIDAAPVQVSITLSRPSREARHLWTLLRPKVEAMSMGFGVERIEVQATSTGRLRHRQMTGAGGEANGAAASDDEIDRSFGELLDALADRLGPDRAVRAVPVESHLPERSFETQSAMPAVRGRGHRDGEHRHADGASVTPSDRPSRLLARPEAIEVMAMTPDGPPSQLRWRGESRRIVTSFGPERIGGEWWGGGRGKETGRRRDEESGGPAEIKTDSRERASVSPSLRLPVSSSLPHRDYFKIQDERGRWLWVYRDGASGRWFVHGEWG